LMVDRQIQMANGVANIRPNVPFFVEVSNFRRKEVTLPKNMVIGVVSDPPTATVVVDERTLKENQENDEPNIIPVYAVEVVNSTDKVEASLVKEKEPSSTWQQKVEAQLTNLRDPTLKSEILAMLERHSQMWSGKLGEIAATEHRIRLKPNTDPIRQTPYRAGHQNRKLINEQVESMLKAGVIEAAQSEWASPVVMVPKKDGSARFCVDYRRLNTVTVKDAYPLPRMDDCIDSLGEAAIFTTLDCNSGYWQIPVAQEDRDKTAFISHVGSYQFLRMPFGLTNAPATFQRALDILLAGVKWQFCLVYLDDVIIFSKTEKEHIQHVDYILTLLKKSGVTLKLKKSEFFQRSVDYLGHTIRPGKLEVTQSGTSALAEAKYPTTQTQLRSYLGSCNVYRRFVKGYSTIAAPLTDLLCKGMPETLRTPPTSEEVTAFETLRKALLNPPVLRLPMPDKPYVLDVDASENQLGCTLLQEHDKLLHPIGYWSKSLTATQRNYSTTEKECLSVFWSISLLRPYLEGNHFTVRTDHNSLTWILSITPSEGRLARWRLRLAEFDFEVQYRPGVKNVVPDSLSRLETTGDDKTSLDEDIPTLLAHDETSEDELRDMYPPEWDTINLCLVAIEDLIPEPITVEEWLSEQGADSLCQQLQQEVDQGTNPRFRLNPQGILVRVLPTQTATQVVVPETLRPRILMSYHQATVAGHPGVRRMYDTLRQGVYWPTMIVDVYATVRGCDTCARDRVQVNKHTNPLKLFPAVKPLEEVAIDLLGPLPKSRKGKLYILVIADRYSKLCRLVALASIKAHSVARAFCESWVFVYGAPRTILSDNGPQFKAKAFLETCRILGIKSLTTTTYHPQTNGQVERFNRTLASMLRHYVANDQKDWDDYLPTLAYAYNRCVHRTTNTTPFDLTLTRAPPILGAELLENEDRERAWSRDHWVQQLTTTYAKANASLKRMQERYKRDFDKAVRTPNRHLRAGDKVFLHLEGTSQEETLLGRTRSKLDFKSLGPYVVISNNGHTFDIDVEGIPERVSSDRVRPAPSSSIVQAEADNETEVSAESDPRSGTTPEGEKTVTKVTAQDGKSTTPERVEGLETRTPPALERVVESSAGPSQPPTEVAASGEPPARRTRSQTSLVKPGSSVDKAKTSEYVIDRICEEDQDEDGSPLFRVRWYNFGPQDDTWEPEDMLPKPLVAAFRRTKRRQIAYSATYLNYRFFTKVTSILSHASAYSYSMLSIRYLSREPET